MKKRLFILPLLALASGVLAGCGNEKDNGKDDEDIDIPEPEPEPEPDPTPDPEPDPDPVFDPKAKLGPESFEDSDGNEHKRVSKIEDGKEYYLAYYRASDDEIRVANGEPHKDKGNEYPFYLGTSLCDAGEEAPIKVSFTDDKHFTMQFDAPGTKYDGKYISIYEANSGFSNQVYSVYMGANIGDPNPDRKPEDSDVCHYSFEFIEEYKDYELGVPAISWTDTRESYAETEDTPKFLGSGENDGVGYISIDCAGWDAKASGDSYHLAFFYEI